MDDEIKPSKIKEEGDISILPKVSQQKKESLYKELTHSIIESLETLAVIDWIHKDDVQREMRKKIKSILRQEGYQFDQIETLTAKIMELARVRLVK
ncbi:MAG: type I restriction enzyme endonuclease domain-containing protein [Elusimicrobiota bacterium]